MYLFTFVRSDRLTEKAVYPSCHSMSRIFSVALAHRELFDLTSPTILASAAVGGSSKSRWAWSFQPPTVTASAPFLRATSAMYAKTRLRNAAVSHGSRCLVEKSTCTLI